MDMIKHDWNMLKSTMEYEIIQKYAYVGTFYAQIFACKMIKLLYYFTRVDER